MPFDLKLRCHRHVRLSRRRLLAGLGAVAAGVFPLKAGAQASPRVVVIGGGWGGLSAARNLKSHMPAAEILLVEPKKAFKSCPLSVHYIVGQRPASSLVFGFEALEKLGVRHVQDTVETIDRASRIVVTGSTRLSYDFLVLSPGIDYMEDAIPGFREHKAKLPIGFRAFEQEAVKRALDAYSGGDIILSVPPMPFRCPIAPYERAAMFADWLSRKQLPGKVILLDQNPDIPIGKPAISAAFVELHKDRLEHHLNVKLLSVNAETRVVETDKGKLSYGMAALVPPQQAAGIVRKAGLGDRWAKVRFPTFLAAADDRIYVIGDSVGSMLPKSGHLAFETGARVADHIAQRVADKSVSASLDLPNAICFAFFNAKEAMAVHIAARWNDLTEEIERKPMVDSQRSGKSATAADDWGRLAWNQLLG